MTPIALLAAILSAAPQANPSITINVDANVSRHTIDERIYGLAWADASTVADLEIPLNRWGGNAVSGYNWAFSTANRCKDYYFFNIPDSVSASFDPSTGGSADDFIKLSRDNGAQPVMTIPLMSKLPMDRSKRCSFPQTLYPAQDDFSCCEPITCGNGNNGGNRIITGGDPNNIYTTYTSAHQGNWVQHMIDTWGNANAGGMTYYSLDNEPMLWSFDHWDVHPTGASYDEVWGKMQEYGALIRSKDPNAIITGGEEWGWSGYFISGLDVENNNSADKIAHGGKEWYDYMLDQAKAYDDAHASRILDVLTVHFYPQSGEFSNDVSAATQGLRNRSTRSLWDPGYVDESWIGGTFHNGTVKLIPRLKDWVANHYPGTKIGITEYNWGAEGDINGATAQADILGIFGRESLDLATRWTTPASGSPVYNAIKMYRNYDGAHAKFGDISVSTSAPTPDITAAFGSLRSSDNALTLMLVNKNADSTPAKVNLANFAPPAASVAKRYQLTSANVFDPPTDVTIDAGPSLSLTLPAQSITLLVIPGPPAPPTPAGFSATATSTSQVSLTWSASSGATIYEVYRSVNHSAYTLLQTITAGTSTTDTGLSADTTYLYKVRAMAGAAASPFTAIDPATTTIFTDDPLSAGTKVKAAHITQLRTAVNAMRAAGGLTAQVFTDAGLATGFAIRGVHVTELRTALDQARSTIGISAMSYTDPTITAKSTKVKAQHVIDLRNGVK